MARTSALDKYPELRDLVARMYSNGASNTAIAEAVNKEWPELETHKDTIIQWRKDDGVAAKVHRFARERASRILRMTDNELLRRLEKLAQKMDTDELLKIRKALLPEVATFTDEKVDKATLIEEIFGAAREDPALAQQFRDAATQPGAAE